ncbi:hypothetical protein AGABI2DRAFT_121157 [Agaricus bisporus var. bisporus H97]|uniref:hypothetical protein n=1 Tax=Agaricus bisporus var. bisporus (strain H97 / ATCC MYA-4626 / FGSC 10389) TaxID=936046 RepID=UPI00029F57BB|nr:hypothetical protein AGABI2DRAFT_121157 [Agaricus bisporus var. bisporus H97]EKV43955.1 hypothetical protein AGABI2DRAFT_121157 [Agaricus bisporus var. bisporus H97]
MKHSPFRSRHFPRLFSYLSDCDNWTRALRSLPELSEALLEQARNSRRGAEANNDLLEFVGDRIVNLVCALVVANGSICPDQQVDVNRAVTSNDTLGRLAFQLGLDRKAHLDDADLKSIIDFSPRYSISPPKALADLFEAYVGAVYDEHGWDLTKDWLEILLKPLVEQATEDYIERPETSLIRGVYVSHKLLHKVEHHQKLFDYIEPRAEDFEIMAGPALFPLTPGLKFVFGPRGDIGNDRNIVDIATHLVKFWICQAFMSEYPENRKAYTKAPHLISGITVLITSSWTLGLLALALRLETFFDPQDPDYSIFEQRLKSPRSVPSRKEDQEQCFRSKLTQVFYAVIGWFYFEDPKEAMKWGEMFFTPLVTFAHDILVRDSSFVPNLPEDNESTKTSPASTPKITEEHLDILPAFQVEDLEARFAEMVIGMKNVSFRHNTDDFRLMIDLDESDDDDDDEQQADSSSHNEICPVESLHPSKPMLAKFKLPAGKRAQILEARLTQPKAVSQAIKIVFSNDTKPSSHSTNSVVKEEQSAAADRAEAPEQEKLEQGAPFSNVINQTSAEIYRDKPLSKEPPSKPLITPHARHEVENHKPFREARLSRHLQTVKREPPREPRALRGLRNTAATRELVFTRT